MEKELVYVLKTGNEISPVFQIPHGLIDLATLVRSVGVGDEIALTPGDTIDANDLVTVDPDEPLESAGVQVAHRNTRSRDGPQYRTSWSRDGPTAA